MGERELAALDKVISQFIDDEEQDFHESRAARGESHIYNALRILADWRDPDRWRPLSVPEPLNAPKPEPRLRLVK
jgi:hypothetical protein